MISNTKKTPRPLRVLPLAACLMMAVVLPRSGSEAVSSAQTPPDEYSLVLLALGSWRGDFHIDRAGRGGLAALHGYTRNRRRLLAARGGALLLLQTGDFTGAKTPAAFARTLLKPQVNLPRYLGFDALALTARENGFLWAQRRRPEFRHFPGISFNRKPPATAAKERKANPDFAGRLLRPRPLAPYRILARGQRNVFITSLTPGPAAGYDPAPLSKLKREMMRQSGADLFVLMLQEPPSVDHHAPGESTKLRNQAVGYFASPMELTGNGTKKTAPKAKNFPPREIMELKRIRNPYDALKTFTPPAHTVLLRSGMKTNRFYRLVNGTFVCEIAGRSLCEVSFRFRDRRIIDAQGRFINLNGADQASAWIAPDRLLMQVLKKSPLSSSKKSR